MKILKGEIVSNDRIGEDIFKMTIFSPYVTKNSIPGQFINIRCSRKGVYDPLLRRPFSIYDVEEDFKVFSIIYMLKGTGTKYLQTLQPGDSVNFMGPLGNGVKTDAGNHKKYLLIGGGIGIAPLHFLAKDLSKSKKNVFLAAGFKNNNFLFFEKVIQSLKINYQFFSEDGTHGNKGIITDFVHEKLNEFKDCLIYCCGPVPMLKVLKELFVKNNMANNAYGLFEEVMACGIGVCKGCVIKTTDENNKYIYKTVCKDGPLFSLKEVIFE